MIIGSTLRARFGNNLESHQIDDDYLDSTDQEEEPILSQTQSQSHTSSPTISQQQWSRSARASSTALRSLGFDQPPQGFNDDNTLLMQQNHHTSNLQHQASYTNLSQNDAFLNELQFDPEEPVPTYETSQLMHQNNNHAPPSEVELAQSTSSDSRLVSRGLPTGLASHLYTPIPSLPIPRTSSMFFADSVETSQSTTPILLQQQRQQQQQHQGNSHSPHHSISAASSSTSSQLRNKFKQTSIKKLGLKFLNARQHFLLACCRDISLIPPLIGLYQSWKRIYQDNDSLNAASYKITTARGMEHFLTGVWCIVAAYLSYSILDSLLVRWIITYSTSAAIVRVLSMSTIMITCELYLVSTFSADGYKYGLHIWILVSCILTLTYIVQNFVTSNLQLEHHNSIKQREQILEGGGGGGENEIESNAASSSQRTSSSADNNANRNAAKHIGQMRAKKPRRFFDFYNIVVFAVVPVGLASFVTMIGLLRSLLILRIDVDQVMKNMG
ncbi:hypothetical protein I9W82_002217 [Candida metapsilosis]|uniref:N-glycosylation protein EOS1 n=1 Tax=Candida metapsilosis TaxID=273372 RepID=A0A8H8DDV9_9ASCO|nr:hypothetical protein I9W82_002217 [Candida metapsilosis]